VKRLALSVLVLLSMATEAFAQEALSPAELDAQRGGVLLAGDIAFEFGAVVRTYAENKLALETRLTWTGDGPVVDQTAAAPDLAGVVTHVVARGQIANVLTNTDSNRDFRQETDVTLTLPGFASIQQGMVRDQAAMRLADDLASGAISALAH